ncbi:hypothetical protein [Desulfoferrobacter suflitae]|uniref:hypothetical protein n=1 Tax=Desulfoferrobacter suflitae TaxID=2865782 RepID=UPI0021641B6D|nr:hypothetical protein [Desulfoferrobacter suflitae]MCK8600086.1 hypothetical protein [Desulfoferrobacter suflitae]
MRKQSNMVSKVAVLVFVLSLLTISTAAIAADTVIEAKVTNVMEKLDKNGNPFSVIIFEEQRTLNGVSYTTEVIATAFRKVHEDVSQVKVGDTIKAIASKREYNGDVTYTLRKVIK